MELGKEMMKMNRARFLFKKEKKSELLDGRTMTYLSNQLGLSYVYINNILNGKCRCSKIVANAISKDKNRSYYFDEIVD